MEKDLHVRDRVGVQDFVLLENHTSEEDFIENLQKRSKEELIYTYIGSVLVSVNPYKNLPIYGSDYVEKYRNVNFYELPPHVFALTDTALRSLRGELINQCILISGESGAGKTEASKKVLQFIAATTRKKASLETVKDKLLQSNPVLEAFGNAKTNRNDNSSRFGKYMDVEFDFTGDPTGGHIINYLLEKSRVVFQAKGERNFHIFYQLLAGADDDLLEKLFLKRDPDLYVYLKQGESSRLSGVDDAQNFKIVRGALHVMEIGDEEQEALFHLLSVIIHLGNVEYASGEGGRASISNPALVSTIAKLLGCPEDKLVKALLNRTIEARDDVVVSPMGRDEAVKARDALSKSVYERMFNWLVQRLNRSLQSGAEVKKKIVLGILDIYGFEIFQSNSFEQLCINYCNEKLQQQLFIELTLKSEQDEYRREGIAWEPVAYFDNKIICDLIEEKHKGIISIMDEECLVPGEANDKTFLNKMDKLLSEHPHYVSHAKGDTKTKKTIEREEFRLVHYAGEVTYNVNGFLEKNSDLLYRDLKEAMISSSNRITKDMFTGSELSRKKRPDTAASQFKTSLAQLVDILVSKEPSYIRCIKPNDVQKPGLFEKAIVTHQVKYLGLMENLRVRRAGFAYRRPYEGFLNRYKSLCPETWPHPKGDAKSSVQTLVNHLKYGKDDYRMGLTKIFIRLPKTLFETEDAFQKRKNELASKIQAKYKGILQRRKYLAIRARIIIVQSLVRRFLAKRLAAKRRSAVAVIRRFIVGFMKRNEPMGSDNEKFLGFVRHQYLLRLAKQLPQSIMDKSWPDAPASCQEANNILRAMYMQWMVGRYCKSLSPSRRHQFEMKVLAEAVFKNNKKSYGASVTKWFVDSRLSNEQKELFRSNFEANVKSQGETILYSAPVTKFDRHGYKARERFLALTKAAVYLLDAKDCKVKHRLTFNDITGITVTNSQDNLIVVRIPEDDKKDKGDLILECNYLIETLTWIVDTCKKRDIIRFESATSLTHHIAKGKPGTIEITRGGEITGISKGKNGHLMVAAT
ncbi:LOW QUALITY PROTEIN: unconventional myosin IC-like [Daphnia magna]|uniref:LOW QUALITY PROTEIN: unconventional myosin IC-like n=1 Tax=Daphnia magna TaxID=35525 RepID=UPI001E1BC8F0|nr:LOW QUALITY PROTEIN: unconventional myosin IC-like [Daphnia magna]